MTDAPRGLARRQPRAHRTAQILASARQVFSAQGYEGAVVSDIAQGAGLSEAAVFKFFPSKRALAAAVIAAWYYDLVSNITEILEGIPDPAARIVYLIHRHVLAIREDPGLCRLVIQELRSAESYHQSELHGLNRRYTAFVLEAVRAGQEQGRFRADVSTALARDMIFGGIEHSVWDFLAGRRDLDVAEAAEQASTFALAALAHPAGRSTEHGLAERTARLERIVERLQDCAGDAG